MRVNKIFDGNKINYLVWFVKYIVYVYYIVYQIIWFFCFKFKVKKINY